MKCFALELTNILWLGAEIVLGTVLCSIPTILQGGIINEQTLTNGLILAGVVLLPLEFYRQFELERKFRMALGHKQPPVIPPITVEPPESPPLTVVPGVGISTTIETSSVFIINVASPEYNTEIVETASVEKNEISHAVSKNIRVFIHAAPPDMPFAHRLEKLLGTTFNYAPPIDFSKGPTEIRECLEHNLKSCDAVIILYGHDSYPWLQAQLSYCRRIRADRDQPLKVVVCNLPSPTKTKRPVPLISNFVRMLEALVLEACLPPIKEMLEFS